MFRDDIRFLEQLHDLLDHKSPCDCPLTAGYKNSSFNLGIHSEKLSSSFDPGSDQLVHSFAWLYSLSIRFLVCIGIMCDSVRPLLALAHYHWLISIGSLIMAH